MHDKDSLFDGLAEAYDAWFDKEGKIIFDTEVKAFQNILQDLPEPWLEIGVGSGRFAQALGIGAGIDPSARLLELATKRGVDVRQARGENSDLEAGKFGAVFLIVTLCFADSPYAILKEAHRILQKKGKLVLGMVLRENPWGQLYCKEKEQGHRFYQYATIHSYPELISLLARSGFIMEKIVSTLFQKPGEVKEVETPREYYSSDAGFNVIVARKDSCYS